MKILNFGSCNIDYVYDVEHIVSPGETVDALGLSKFPGGKGLNQSIAIAKSGMQVYHAGCIGHDGAFLKQILDDNGVDTTYLRTVEETTGHAVIQVNEDGQNSILLYGGANKKTDFGFIDEVLGNFGNGDILVLQNEIGNIEYIIDKAYDMGMCTVLNPSPFGKVFERLDLEKINYLILNEIEAFQFTKEKDIDAIREFFSRKFPNLKVVLTLGINGSIYFDKESSVEFPAFSVNAVDTTAAGDTYLGYFVSCIAGSVEIKEALKFSSAAAAVSVTRKGASVSIPTIDTVNRFIMDNVHFW